MNALTTFLIMATILVLVWLWVRKQTDDPQKKTFTEIADHNLDADKKLKVLEINNEVWILAISADTVNLLHKFPKDDWGGLSDMSESSESTFYKMFRRQQDV
jgi:flagellar biogenesis protein FliO